MARDIGRDHLLDDEVSNLVRRIGASRNPKHYMQSYNINRRFEGTTLVTVTFVADDDFSRARKEGINA